MPADEQAHGLQGDHSPDIVKFNDIYLTVRGVGMQQCMIRNQNEMHKFGKVKNGCKYCIQLTINSFRQLFPDNIFS